MKMAAPSSLTNTGQVRPEGDTTREKHRCLLSCDIGHVWAKLATDLSRSPALWGDRTATRRRFPLGTRASMINSVARARLYDLAWATPLILWLGLGIVGSAFRIAQGRSALEIGSQLATIVFLGLVITFLMIRRPAVHKAPGLAPRLTALVGCALPSLLALLPRVTTSPSSAAITSAIAFSGTIVAIISVFSLGRSFSVFPQARGLVTDGPYRIVRHPIYLAELAMAAAFVWDIVQPWPIVMICFTGGVQIMRMHFEERILSETFPSYHEYAKRTSRLVPGIY